MKKLLRFLILTVFVFIMLGFSIGSVQAGPCELPDFDSEDFTAPTDNDYLPIPDLSPGEVKTYVYDAEDEEGLIRNYISYSTDTVTILGVTCIVVYDVEWVWVEDIGAWRKLEETQDWHAWDNFGNFWYFGEDTTEFEYDDDWVLIGSNNDGSWIAGDDGASPGIILPADPKQGDCYKQEYYEDEAEDVGKVLRFNAEVSVEYGDFEECMVMKEWTALEPGNVEHKIYAEGVGLVYIKELKEKTVEVELVDINNDPIPDHPALFF